MKNIVEPEEVLKRKNGKYEYNLDELGFLQEFNNRLVELDNKLTLKYDEEYINIWILGLPRSGTTLLSQLLYNCTNLYCTNNLMAKFWNAPIVGSYLSRILIGEKSNSYESDFGKTSKIDSPHEFSWFWHSLLEVKNIKEYQPQNADKIIDWQKLRMKILAMNEVFKGGIVFKPLEFVGYHIKRFQNLFNKSIILYIDRSSIDIALSLALTRLKYYNDLDIWWGSYPLEYEEIKELPFSDQIPAQIFFLKKLYTNAFGNLEPNRIIQIKYEQLCKEPQKVISEILTAANKISQDKVKQIKISPEKFQMRSNKGKLENKIEEAIISGLQKYKLI